MKYKFLRISLILIIILLASSGVIYAQEIYSKIPYEKVKLYSNTIYKIGKIRFEEKCDTQLNNIFLKYSQDYSKHKSFKIIDTAEYSPYKSDLYVFKSTKYSDYLIVWEIENEYDSEIKLFYINNESIYKVCNLPIRSTCTTCDFLIYPIDKLIIKGDTDFITIGFQIPLQYKLEKDKWTTFKQDELEISFDKKTKKYKLHWSK